jgi:hypothetical protein
MAGLEEDLVYYTLRGRIQRDPSILPGDICNFLVEVVDG